MSDFLEFAKQFEVKENNELREFTKSLDVQKKAFEKNYYNRRSWVKKDEFGYKVKLGKLESVYAFTERQDVVEFLNRATNAAQSDEKFQAAIEKAYGGTTEDKPKRTRKARTPKTES